MIKIIFITNKLITGGVEKALLSMINIMPKDKYKITIGVFDKGGNFEDKFPSYVDIIKIPQVDESIKSLLVKDITELNLINIIKRLYNLLRCNVTKNYNKQCIFKSKIYDILPYEYDVAIAYHKPVDLPVTYVLNNIVSSKKILWLHGEVKETNRAEKKSLYKIYKQYNQIICVSKSIQNQVNNLFPVLMEKTEVINNFINEEEIIRLSEIGDFLEKKDNYTRILTVARLSREKGIDLLIESVQKLKEDNIYFKWFVVGDGPMKNEAEIKIQENNLTEYVELLGNKENPYGYFKSCDIYVQPSLEEGFGLTISEAKIFYKPIILTNFTVANEHISNEVTGYIVNFNSKDISEKIKEIIKNPKISDKFRENLKLEKEEKCYARKS